MKTLLLLRHAKSSWRYPELSDYERPLNKRGRRDAPTMGKWLKNNSKIPGFALSSPAVRTLATISRLGHALGLKGSDYHTDSRLYHASPETILEIIRNCSESVNSLLLVGHNPGLTEVANQLCPEGAVENIPTCGVFSIAFTCDKWADISPENSEFQFFQYPKNLP